jgi:hypothetical protein
MSLDGGVRLLHRLVIFCYCSMMRQQRVALAASGVDGSLLYTCWQEVAHDFATWK